MTVRTEACPEFVIEGHDRRAEGRQRGWGSWRGNTRNSNPLPPARGLGSAEFPRRGSRISYRNTASRFHFGNESFQSITCTGTDNLTRTTRRQNTKKITEHNQNGPSEKETKTKQKHIRKKSRIIHSTGRGLVALYDPPRLRNDLCCVEWDAKYHTIPYHTYSQEMKRVYFLMPRVRMEP